MPFKPLAVQEQDAPDRLSRRELDEYMEHLLTLTAGKEHLIYVEKGEPMTRKVKALDEKGNPLTQLEESSGKLIPLYATTSGDPKPANAEGVEFVTEDTGRGRSESKDYSGFVAAGAEKNINVSIRVTQKGRGRLEQDTVGVWQFVKDDNEPEITLLRLVRSTPRNDTPEGRLKKSAGQADARMKRMQEQLNRATKASESFKAELQEKIDGYQAESEDARSKLKALKEAKTEEAKNKLLVEYGLKPAVEEEDGKPEEAPAKTSEAPAKASGTTKKASVRSS